MPRQVITGSVINGDFPLAVSVVEMPPVRHLISGSMIGPDTPLAVAIMGGAGGIISNPPPGAYRVVNIYVILVDGQPKFQIEYDTGD